MMQNRDELILDSGSLIYIAKCNLKESLLKHFDCIVPESVFQETTRGAPHHPDAMLIQENFSQKLRLIPILFVENSRKITLKNP